MGEIDGFKSWLGASPLSLPGRVILSRTELSAREILAIRREGVWHVPATGEEVFLEVGGRTLARGKVVERGKGTFFKVTHLVEENDGAKK